MNVIAVIILTALIINFLLSTVSDYLNIKNLRVKLPDEFRDVYDEERLIASSEKLLSCDAIDRIFYAMKANNNKNVLKILQSKGLNFECV